MRTRIPSVRARPPAKRSQRLPPKEDATILTARPAKLTKTFAAQNGLKEDYIAVYAGSSEPAALHRAGVYLADRGFVTADPSYEAGMMAARFEGEDLTRSRCKADYSHDVKAMVAADPEAGVIYICNPNNPTGTLTAKEDIAWALENKPAGRSCWSTRPTSIYPMHRTCWTWSRQTRTSLSCAPSRRSTAWQAFAAVSHWAALTCWRSSAYGSNAMPITGSAAANVSLLDAELVPSRKKIIGDTRNDTFDFLTTNNYKFIPSQSNCFMIDTGRNGKEVIAAMQAKNVYIGRTWPIWPNFVRVTVGTPAEMAKFKVAFTEVMGKPPTAGLQIPLQTWLIPYLS